MFSLRTHVVICATLFALLIGGAILGNVLQKLGVSPPSGNTRYVVAGLYFAIFFAFGFSAVPVIVKLVLGAQVSAGNENVGFVGTAIRHQNAIIWTMWGVMFAGSVIAVPAALIGGMFGDGPKRAFNRMFEGPRLGIVVARPDMTLDEMLKESTAKIETKYASAVISANGVFEFRIPGTAISFPNARYYYMTTYSDDHTRLRAVNVGTSREKGPRATIDSADAELRAQLTADGWLTGHEVYRTEEDQTLHGGKTEGPEGHHWLKDGMVLTIARKRIDDAKPGEDIATAGEWIQYIDLWPAKGYSGMERMVFQAPRKP